MFALTDEVFTCNDDITPENRLPVEIFSDEIYCSDETYPRFPNPILVDVSSV